LQLVLNKQFQIRPQGPELKLGAKSKSPPG
jgi:hypothetical protein